VGASRQQKLTKLITFLGSLFKAFGALQAPLGSRLGPYKSVLDGLGTPKTISNCIFKVFANADFCDFEALNMVTKK
jgi:hypothetical protein